MNLPLEYRPLLQLSDDLRRGAITSSAVTKYLLDRITAIEPTTQCFATITADHALVQAKQADDEIGRGFWRGPLHGVPIALKDLCFTKNAPTSAGMAIHKNWIPDFDATVVERLYDAGAVSLGKLKMTEGAAGAHHPAFGAPRNPWNGDYWPGVSSSGSGVATAAGLCFGTLGSDTGGSIRYPSSCNNLTGLKPTYGRVSRHGIFTLSDSLDHIGPMARTAGDCAAILGIIAGDDPNDPTTLDEPVPNYLAEIANGIRGLRVGLDMSFAGEGSDDEVIMALSEAQRALIGLGAEIKEVRFPSTGRVNATAMPVFGAEALDAHRETYPSRAAEYGSIGEMLDAGTKATGLAFAEANRERRKFCGSVQRLWRDIDVLLIPALPTTVPTVKVAEGFADPKNMIGLMRFTFPFNLTGSPSITLPSGFSKNGLPIGVQLVGRHLSESLLLQAGHAFQQATDWHTRHPKL